MFLIIEGVGFSYCDDAVDESQCVNTDESTALDAYEFIVNWFNSFDEYKSNKFYITGESYAGIYIPMLMDQIDKDVLGSGLNNLVGAAIGNGCWGTTVGTCAHGAEQQNINADFFFGHGMYSQPLRETILAACGDFSTLTDDCQDALDVMYEQMGDYDVYNIYDECGEDNLLLNNKQNTDNGRHSILKEVFAKLAQPNVTVLTQDSFTVSGGYWSILHQSLSDIDKKLKTDTDYKCGGHQAMNAWLAEPSVMEALHVLPNTVGMTYSKTAGDLIPLYTRLITKYQMLIYSGDTDGCVPYVGTEKWTRDLPFKQTRGWHQWFAHPSHGSEEDLPLHGAGYATTYDKFQFVTVAGAGIFLLYDGALSYLIVVSLIISFVFAVGHMVPTFQPGYALELFQKFLNNEEF